MADDPEHLADSAGVPWRGRRFPDTPASTDDGSAPPALLAALTSCSADGRRGPVIDALRDARLLVPLLAERGEEGVGAHGRTVDKTQELALVTVSAPDGRTVLPAFSSVTAMARWNSAARPIPVDARRVALAAAADDTDLVVIDPGSPTECLLGRAALRALATGERWIPPWDDPDIRGVVIAGTAVESAIVEVDVEPTVGGVTGAELSIVLTLVPGLDRRALDELFERLGAAWAGDRRFLERVDAASVRLR